jgi:hypothetical protein
MLVRELLRSGFSLQLQSREEPFGMTVVEAMRAGCVVLASPEGAIPELIEDGRTGFLVPGDPASDDVLDRATSLVLGLVRDPDALMRVRQNARAAIWDTDTLARVWTAHWAWLLKRSGQPAVVETGPCPRCGGERLSLEDGHHCTRCSIYSKRAAEAVR